MGKLHNGNMMDLFSKFINAFQSRFNERSYWKMREYCQNHHNILQKLYLIRLRRIENSMCASTGLGLNTPESPMCQIASPLNLPYRLNNIIIARNVRIGNNVTIYQNVTIAEENKQKTTVIGDNVMIGAGAVILKNVKIGDNVKIGANTVVVSNIMGGVTVVGNPARIIAKK